MSEASECLAPGQRSELAALDCIRAELENLSDDELLRQNVVPVEVLVTLRGVLPNLMRLRARMAQLQDFNVDYLDRLELFAMAFAGAQAQYEIIKEHNKEPTDLLLEGVALRRQLVSDLKVLVRRGLVAPERLKKLRNQRGYKQVAADLLLLATIFRTHSGIIAGKCAATAEEIDRADVLADKLTVVVSQRNEPFEAEVAALKTRQRAYTQFFRAYHEVRRAVRYLRDVEGDADRFAPPLSGKRKSASGSSTKNQSADAENPVSQNEPAKPNYAPESSVSSRTALATEEEANTDKKTVGLPGSDPFLH